MTKLCTVTNWEAPGGVLGEILPRALQGGSQVHKV